MFDSVVISGEDVYCSVFSVMWSELLMTSAISCPLWSSVYECHKMDCVFTSLVRTEHDWYVCDVLSRGGILQPHRII